MTDYIKREDALNFIENGIYMDTESTERTIKRFNDAVQSADVVEVVRCKDCRYWNHETDLTYCSKKAWLGTDAEDYCSFGERAEA